VTHIDGPSDEWALGEALARSYLERVPPPDGWRERLCSLDLAYTAQDAAVKVLSSAGKGTVAGYKVGLTSKAMQRLCGIDTPICGCVLSNDIHLNDVELRRDRYMHLGIESELAFRMGRDIDRRVELSDNDVLAAIESMHPAFEIVDDRNANYARLSASEIIAENSWNVGIVLGEGVSPTAVAAIDRIQGQYFENDEEIGGGSSADVLGNPLNVVRWLSQFLLARGSMLRAGDIVMSGSIVVTRFPPAGTACRFVLDGLPAVTLRIA